MPLLARKITVAKWNFDAVDKPACTPADAITVDLKTGGNRLSFWRIPDNTMVDDVVLAMVSSRQQLAKYDIAAVDEQTLIDAGIEFVKCPGETLVEDMRPLHQDAISLDYVDLGNLADAVIQGYKQASVHRRGVLAVAKIVVAAIKSGRLDESKLLPKFVAEAVEKVANADADGK